MPKQTKIQSSDLPSKSELFIEWCHEFIYPFLEVDERHPQYQRIACLPNQVTAIEQFQKWIEEKEFPTGSSLSFCASSTVRQFFIQYVPEVLWGTECMSPFLDYHSFSHF